MRSCSIYFQVASWEVLNIWIGTLSLKITLLWLLLHLSGTNESMPLTIFITYLQYPYHRITHYGDVIMGAKASQITSLTIVYSTVYSDSDQRKHQSSASLASVRGIHRGPVNSLHKRPVTQKMFPFDDVIMLCRLLDIDLSCSLCGHVFVILQVRPH